MTFALPLGWDLPLLVLAVSVLIGSPARAFSYSLTRRLILLGAAAFVVTTVLAVSNSSDIGRSALGAAPLVPGILMCATIGLCASHDGLRQLYLSLTVLGLLVAGSELLGWLVNASPDPARWVGTFSRVVSVPNDTVLLAALAPVLLVVLLSDRSTAARVAGLLGLILCATVVVLARSRAGLVTLLFGLLVTLLALRGRRLATTLVAVVCASILVDALSGFELARKFVYSTGESRFALWWAAWLMWLDAPLLGHGANMFGVLYPDYLGRLPDAGGLLRIDAFHAPWPHNIYVELLAERGLFAFTAFILTFLVALHAAWSLCRKDVSPIRPYAAAMLGGLAAIGLAGLAELTLLHLWVPVLTFAMFGIVAALENVGYEEHL